MNKIFYDCTLAELKEIVKACKVLARIDQSDNLHIDVKGTFVDRKNVLVFLNSHRASINIDSIGKGQFFSAKVDDCFTDIKLAKKQRMDIYVTF